MISRKVRQDLAEIKPDDFFSFEKALRCFRQRFENSKIPQILKMRRHDVSPSARRRAKALRAERRRLQGHR